MIGWRARAYQQRKYPLFRLAAKPRFLPATPKERRVARKRFGIRPEEVVIGSFQKDGEGWGDTPKLIKGPDIFLAAIERLVKDLPVFVLLSGPARSYVRRGL